MTSPSETTATTSGSAGSPAAVDAAPVKRYSLFTAICLIVGICIGSGIFFKSDNILIATGGNVALGVAMMLLAATTIIFGGLTLARFAARTTGHGGLIAYAEEFLGPRRAAFIGWNFTFLYMPVVCSVLSWVVGVCACMTFSLPGTFAWQMGIGLVFLLACTAWNILWPTLSGYFQNLTTLAKALPLVLVGVIGLMVNDPVAQLSSDIAAAPAAGTGWIAAAAPIAFAFDGWSSAVSIAPELKDARRNLPRALVAAPIIILVLYLGYFVGISCFLGPQTVIQAGDASLSLMFVKLFGEQAGALPNVIAFIAVLGGANGIGLLDIVENRLVGMKSRGVYETPGGAILYKAINVLETITLDKESAHFKAQLAQKYADIVYNGQWFTPLREALDAFADSLEKTVTGDVKLKLYKGNMINAGVTSPYTLYDEQTASFGVDKDYDQSDATGFINLFGLSIKERAKLSKNWPEVKE